VTSTPPEDDCGPTADVPAGRYEPPILKRGSCVGRYVVVDPIGAGGMGVIYKAYDPELNRPVALKLLLAEEGPLTERHRERLLREAQALAQLSHPNVIAVHDVGAFGTQVFIATEFVDGQTVRKWLMAGSRTRREILDVFVAAGEGLAAAHRAGLVHRDFKPDNVMVGNDGRVCVLDFGIVRAAGIDSRPDPETQNVEASAAAPALGDPSHPSDRWVSKLTHVGSVIGTPRFMAPEQHQRGEVDARADQFSFCLSLYWALYGQFPFAGETVPDLQESMRAGRVSAPPEGSSVPRWLRQVLLRGLAVAPAERYPSMAELLAALRADPHAQLRRWLRAAMVVLAALAAVSAVVAGAIAYRARRAAAAQALLAQQFGREVEHIAAIARTAVYQPLHDTRRERTEIAKRMELVKERMRVLGAVAAGPGHEALGRGYLALERYDDALRELEASYATGYRSPELAYALGLVHGKLYQRALAGLPKNSVAQQAEITRLHRDPALRYLREAGSRGQGGQMALDADAPAYVEGLIALYEQRYDDALRLAQKAEHEALWTYEAQTLEGDIHFVAGQNLWLKGDAAGALDHFGQAGEAYRAASESARSGFGAYIGACQQLGVTIRVQVAQHLSPESTVKAALAACGAAATTRPDDATPVAAQASAWYDLASYQTDHGTDPGAASQQAVRTAEAALAIEPDNLAAHNVLAYANLTMGDYRSEKGDDPRPMLGRALEHAQRMVEINPRSFDGYDLLNRIYESRGWYVQDTGGDPRRDYQLASENARKTIALLPDGFPGWNALAASNWYMGAWEAKHSHDPAAAFTRAEDAYANVVRISAKLSFGHSSRCSLLRVWADYERRTAVDPRPRLEQSIASGRRALEVAPNDAYSHFELGEAVLTWARWQLDQAIDPTEMIERARGDFRRALEIDTSYQSALAGLAESDVLEARWSLLHGRDPIATLARAASWARRGLELSSGRSTDALAELAEISRWRAEWHARGRQAVTADVDQGLAYVARGRAHNPQLGEAAAVEGALHLVAARTASSPAARLAAAGRASTALETALRIDKTLEREYRPLYVEAQRIISLPREP
jgi:serine/threonine-protein kinase